MAQNLRGKGIVAGYPWRIRLQFASSITFDGETTIVSQVRETPASQDTIIELTTENDGIEIVDETTLELRIPETEPSIWPAGKTVVLDLVRTDGSQNEHLGIFLQVPVRKPVTRV